MGSPMKLLGSAIELRSTYPRWLSGPGAPSTDKPQEGHRADLLADAAFDIQIPCAHFPRCRAGGRWTGGTGRAGGGGAGRSGLTANRQGWRLILGIRASMARLK